MISLNEEVLKDFVNVLVNTNPELHQLYLQSILNESGKGTKNSFHQYKWDRVYNSILLNAEKHGLKYWKIKRGKFWEALALIGPENELYIFFSEKNLSKIIKTGKGSHYLKLLNLFNEHFDSHKPLFRQGFLDLFLEKEHENEFNIDDAIKMLEVLNDKPSRVIIFGFDTTFNSSVRAYVFNSKNQLVWEQSLSHLIDTNYSMALSNDYVNPGIKESENKNDISAPKKQQIVRLKNS